MCNSRTRVSNKGELEDGNFASIKGCKSLVGEKYVLSDRKIYVAATRLPHSYAPKFKDELLFKNSHDHIRSVI